MSKEARNEQRKLLATWFNNVGTGIISVGVLAPGVALVSGVPSAASSDTLLLMLAGAMMAGWAFHTIGRLVLTDFEP